MAYMSQDKKKAIEAVVKPICKRYGVKATLAVRHNSTLVLNIAEGPIDFFGDRATERWRADFANPQVAEERLAKDRASGNLDVNPYGWRESFKGAALAFLAEVMPALNDGNWDKSDSMTDYFNVGWYVDVNVGRWNKPYKLNPSIPAAPPVPAPAPSPEAAAIGEVCRPGLDAEERARSFARYVAARETEESLKAATPVAAPPQLRIVKPEPEYLTIPAPFAMARVGRC